jgi:Uncharacterized protein conserved in bacteria
MEKSIDLLEYMKEQFALNEVDIKTYSPLTLAYIGDGVYELIIRSLLVMQGNTSVDKLHKRASKLVKASAQSAIIEELLPLITEEEANIFKRGRNAKSFTVAKNASMSDYRRATGLEALIGYLYLQGDMARAVDLVKIGLEKYMQE